MNHEQIDEKYQPTEQERALRLTINRVNAATNYADQIAILERFLRHQLWEHGIGDREDHLPPQNLPQLCIDCAANHYTDTPCVSWKRDDIQAIVDSMPGDGDLIDKRWSRVEDADV